MTDTERLEYVVGERRYIREVLLDKVVLSQSNYEWLIEQAQQTLLAKEDVRVIEIKIDNTYAENKKLREALEFYADDENHKYSYEEPSPIYIDGGTLAKEILEELK